jgi:hypothetical protein
MCEHRNFQSYANIVRIVDNDFVTAELRVELRVQCVDCGLPFEFVGPPCGVSDIEPTVSYNRQELRVPIKATSDPVDNAKSILTQSLKKPNK